MRQKMENRDTYSDEFYTRYEDALKEFNKYDFTGKTVFCPCDGRKSKIPLALKDCKRPPDLIISAEKGSLFFYVWRKDMVEEVPLHHRCKGFQDEQLEPLYITADVIITNPPFSLFSNFIKHLQKRKKAFLVLGRPYYITDKRFKKRIFDPAIIMGKWQKMKFEVPESEGYMIRHEDGTVEIKRICWIYKGIKRIGTP